LFAFASIEQEKRISARNSTTDRTISLLPEIGD